MSDFVLLETGDRLLLETGDKALLEDAVDFTLDDIVIDVVVDAVLPTYSIPDVAIDIVLDVVAFALAELAVEVVPGEPVVGLPTVARPYGAPRWRVRVVTMDNVGVGEFASANVDSVEERLNDLDEANFTISTNDPLITAGCFDIDDLDDLKAQVWRDGDLLMAGPMVRLREDFGSQTAAIQVFSSWWHWTGRFLSGIERPDRMVNGNGGFEDSGSVLTNWATVGSITTSIETAIVNEGARSAKLVNGAGAYISQSWTERNDFPGGLLSRLVVFWYIPVGQPSPAENLLAELILTHPTNPSEVYRSPIIVDDDSPRGSWQYAYADRLVGPGINWAMERRVYGSTGTLYVDSIKTVRNEAPIATLAPGEDQVVIPRKLVEYGQDVVVGFSHVGVGHNCAPTGVIINVGYTEGDHRNLDDILTEQVRRDGAYDWAIVRTPTTETLTTYYPERGTYRPEHRLELGRQIASGTVEVDRSQQANSAIVLGETSSFDREEGGARDTSVSSVIRQKIVRAPAGMPVQFLDDHAVEIVNQAKQLPKLLRVRVTERAGELIHILEPGDTVPAVIDSGLTKPIGDFRIVSKKVLRKPDSLELTLAPVPA